MVKTFCLNICRKVELHVKYSQGNIIDHYGPELLNVSIRRIRLNSRILLIKKIGVISIYKVIDVM